MIKRYRERIKDKTFPELNHYCDDFFEYLSTDAFGENCYVSYVKQRAADLFHSIISDVDLKVKKTIQDNEGIEEEEISKIHQEIIQETFLDIKKIQKHRRIKNADVKESIKKYRQMVADIIDGLKENRPLQGTVKRKVVDTCLLFAILTPGINESGVVLAGFGDNEVFPSAKAFEIQKILDGEIEFRETFCTKVTLDNTVSIKAFAQSNEVQSFMNGISSRLHDYIYQDMENILANALGGEISNLLVKDGLISEDKKNLCTQYIKGAANGVYSYLRDAVEDISRREFIAPVISAVKFFSPTEMASMAETLVSLESFRQQVTLSHETVGGPIDVAVITRGDGFIWIKRKHYFDPQINQQFFYNYNRETGGKDEDKEH